MRSIKILITGVLMLFFAFPGSSQNRTVLDSTISIHIDNRSVIDVLDLISTEIDYEFSYNPDLFKTTNLINNQYYDIKLNDLLYILLDDTSLIFRPIDKQIVISKRSTIDKIDQITINKRVSNFFEIKGKILDKDNNPLSYANVSVLGKSLGTVSNEKGRFSFKIPKGSIHDTIVISFIGYKSEMLPITESMFLSENTFYLDEESYTLQEAVIKSYDVYDILEKSLKNIKGNYYTDPYKIVSFYRESIMNKNKVASIVEAVMEVYKSPYMGLFADQIKILKSRKNEYYSTSDTVSLKLKGGLYASLRLDVIKNTPLFLSSDHFQYYDYKVSDILYYDDKQVYVIDFNPNVYLEDNTFEGQLFINAQSYVIEAAEFNITEDALQKIAKNMVVKKSFGTKVNPVSVKYFINYRKIGQKYFINYARGELDFKVKYKRKLFSTDFKTNFEFASNNIDTLDIERFERNEIISADCVFLDENYAYDSEFWGNFNYIVPNQPLEEALIRIQKKLDAIKNE